MKAKQHFSNDILAVFRQSKGLHTRAGTGPHRFIGIWVVVVNDRVFVRSWSVKPQGWYRVFLKEPRGTVQIADREIAIRAVRTRDKRVSDAIDASLAFAPEPYIPGALLDRGVEEPLAIQRPSAAPLHLFPFGHNPSQGLAFYFVRDAASGGETEIPHLVVWHIVNIYKLGADMEKKEPPANASAETRRQVLKIVVGSAATTVGFPILIDAASQVVSHAAHMQARETPGVPYVLKYFSKQQARTLDALCEIIIPADDHSPGAKAAKVSEYIDEIVSSAADTRKVWADGLSAMDRMAREQYTHEYAQCTTDQQVALMEKISRSEAQPATLEEKFFVALKAATIDGYYTSKIGIHQDLTYQGNTMVVDFQGCTHEEHKRGVTKDV